VPTLLMANQRRASHDTRGGASPGFTLTAAVLGFFVITLDAVVVNVALPSTRGELGGGITGLQWVVDGYMLMFAALLLSAGALADRAGARRAFGAGLCSPTGQSRSAPKGSPLAALMILVGLAGPFVMPPVTAVLLNSVPGHHSGVASGVFSTSRQIGGALAVAVFGALLANRAMSCTAFRSACCSPPPLRLRQQRQACCSSPLTPDTSYRLNQLLKI
jgi:MFS transporter, DHA2 family, methylenomycin A resistance protein